MVLMCSRVKPPFSISSSVALQDSTLQRELRQKNGKKYLTGMFKGMRHLLDTRHYEEWNI